MDLWETRRGDRAAVGTFAHLGGGASAECLALAGFDYVIVDNEHGPFSVEGTQEMIRGLQLHGCRAFVRVSGGDRPSILRMLDIGADALIIPDVHTVEEVRDIVSYAKYFPVGRRGFAYSRSAGYGTDQGLSDLHAYFEAVNTRKWVIPQCETVGSLESIEEIAAIDGVDGIFLGPYDLSVALGAPARFDTPEFRGAVERVLSACKAQGKISMIFAGSGAQARVYRKQGFDMVAVGTDTGFLINRCKEVVQEATRQEEEELQ